MRILMSQTRKAQEYKLLDVPTGEERGQLKRFGGSEHDAFNYTLMQQAEATVPSRSEMRDQDRLQEAALGAMIGMQPGDEFEGILITHLLAAHHAGIECYRIGGDPQQPWETRQLELNQAHKLTRTCVTIVDSIKRHRGKGKQQIRVEHVHVNSGGQAIVGIVNRGAALPNESEREPNAARAIEYQPETPMRRAHPQWEPVPIAAGDGEEALPNAWRRAG
jgi:hypothetical protein